MKAITVEMSTLTAHEHDADGEDLFGVRVGAHVAKADAGQAAEGKVEGGDVGARRGGSARRAVDVGHLQTLPQFLQPAWCTNGDSRFGTFQKTFQKLFCLGLIHGTTVSPKVSDEMSVCWCNVKCDIMLPPRA